MLKSYINQQYLKGFVPALDKYLRIGEIDYLKQKEKSEQIVMNDFTRRGYDVRELMPELELSTEAVQDEFNRLRLVAETLGTATVTLYGSNDNNTFNNLLTINSTVAETRTELINESYSYYKISGTNYNKVYLVESVYDLFFCYKWLELILSDMITNEDDIYSVKTSEYYTKYADLFRAFKPKLINSTQINQTNNLEILR